MSALHDQVFAELKKLPKPVTKEAALELANSLIQDGKQRQGFEAWLNTNAAHLLEMVNKG